ncbi:MAG TPA: DmsE family decaheme c-type cytochrome [Vicinamibacterales bacterium]|nr:DmsE family decaheme c-type cytochrome [Vicinamibacterales bacterium]
MKRFGNWAVFLATVAAVAGVGISALAGPGAAPPALAAPALATAAPPLEVAQASQAGYIGTEACVVCHEGFDTTINATKHGLVRNERTPAAAQGCETCHGPGEAHSQDPENVKLRQFDHLSAKAVSDTCATCHNRGEHANWQGSQHEVRNVSCVTCHSVHSPKSPKAQLKAVNQLQLCATCHRDKVNKLDRSGHMPVREGKMECTSCHNPHGSTNVRLLRAGNSINESCASCHAEKRGPYLFEHGGISGDSCATCHDPHGSSNDRLLVAKLPFLCQRCHNHTRHPSTIYDNRVTQTSNRLYSRSCVTCHSAIHGSNHPSGSTFLR